MTGRLPGRLAAVLLLAASLARTQTLADRIDRLLNESPAAGRAFWGVQIADLETGRTLYERNPGRFFVPASNAKLFTAALALTRLGPDFTFQTRVVADAAPDTEGRIRGGVRLVGGGDPGLSMTAIAALADQVAARGIQRIDGDIVGDDTWYEWEPYPEGWSGDGLRYGYEVPVSALSLDDNALTLAIRAGRRTGDLVAISLGQSIEYYRIDNRVRTVVAGGEKKIGFERDLSGRQVRLWGSIPVGGAEDLTISIDDPAEYAAMALHQALEERGVAVRGGAGARHRYSDETPIADAGPAEIELARRVSAPLIEDLRKLTKESLNLHAELALRATAKARRGVASQEAAIDEMKAFLSEAGIDPEAFRIADGSGLSRLNLVTPGAVVGLLRHMYASPVRANWISLLPVGGVDGTLSERLGSGAARGRIHAKTGTLSHVIALSGYAGRRSGGWVAFSILVNNHGAAAAEVRGVVDRICTLMVE